MKLKCIFIGIFMMAFVTAKAQSEKQQIKNNALKVLSTKCNVCHVKQNRKRVFNSVLMDTYAEDIYKQVFVKKRMPKGKEIKLSEAEYKQLADWLRDQIGTTEF